MKKPRSKEIVQFSVKGQVVIPRRLRKEFAIGKGTRAVVLGTAEGILLKPVSAKQIKAARGLLKRSKSLDLLVSERTREKDL